MPKIKIVSSLVRPNTTVPFWSFTPETKTYITATYPILTDLVMSEDKLTWSATRIFDNQEMYNTWKDDARLSAERSVRDADCQTNGVQHTVTVTEV